MSSQQTFRNPDLVFPAAVFGHPAQLADGFMHQGGFPVRRLNRVGSYLAVNQYAATICRDGYLSTQRAVQCFDFYSGYVDLRDEHP
jgi:hypothetical protein